MAVDRADGEHAPAAQSLEAIDFDSLLREVLARVQGAVDEQDRLRHLLDAVVGVAADLSLEGVLTRIVSAASTLVAAKYVALGVLGDGPERRLRTFVHHGMDADLVARIGELPTGDGLLGLLLDDPHPRRLHDLGAHPESCGFPEHHPPMRSFLGVPVRVREQVFGSLYLTEKVDGTDFTEHDERVVVALAAAAGVAIENARLYEEQARRQAWLSATAEIIALLVRDSSHEHALQVVADRARTVSGADVAWVVAGAVPDDLRLVVVSGAPVDLPAMQALAMRESLASIVVRTGRPTSVEDLTTSPHAVNPSSLPGWPTLGPALVVPLGSGGRVEGALSLAWTSANRDGLHLVDPALPAAFAEQAALALHLARSRDDRERLALYEDRDRIGRDLHDLVIQRLFAVGLGLQSSVNLIPEGEISARVQQAIDDLDDTIRDIRRTIFALGSFETSADVQGEIENLVARAGSAMKLRPRLRLEGPIRTLVGPDLAPDVLAVLSEALTNVARHADASSVDVWVAVCADLLEVRVSDDGRGMGPGILASGLDNMRARAEKRGGTLEVDTADGTGTRVTWSVPLEQAPGGRSGSARISGG